MQAIILKYSILLWDFHILQNLPQVSFYHEITSSRVYAFIVQTNILGIGIDKVVPCGGFATPIALIGYSKVCW